jgi:hypothetical protein
MMRKDDQLRRDNTRDQNQAQANDATTMLFVQLSITRQLIPQESKNAIKERSEMFDQPSVGKEMSHLVGNSIFNERKSIFSRALLQYNVFTTGFLGGCSAISIKVP